MKKNTWRKHHKWAGIIICFFLIMFCLSGVVLNHRQVFRGAHVSRGWLPDKYRFHNWNNGLLRGTLKGDNQRIFIYGAGGIFMTDSAASAFASHNDGLPEGADQRQIRSMVKTSRGEIFAASIWGLYRLSGRRWSHIELPVEADEQLADLILRNDTMVLLSRSFAYVSTAPYASFKRIQLGAPEGYKNQVSLFRQMWLLHSGALFGTVGKLVMDIIALALVALCITGIWFWLRPQKRVMAWHDGIGRYTIILTLLIALTGWCLRPPLMIPLTSCRTKPMPGTVLSTDNAWNDKLRMIRYDSLQSDWLLSTSEGFYSLRSLLGRPKAVVGAPPVSVMGQTVWQRYGCDMWIVGSFSGLYLWDRRNNSIRDYLAGRPSSKSALPIKGIPISEHPISGYSSDFSTRECIVDYADGSNFSPQPEALASLPMSLWNVSLEVHTGRIYMSSLASFLFIFFVGLIILWCLVSGYVLRRRKHPKQRAEKSIVSSKRILNLAEE